MKTLRQENREFVSRAAKAMRVSRNPEEHSKAEVKRSMMTLESLHDLLICIDRKSLLQALISLEAAK